MANTYYDDWLQHHGVKGMKWGVKKAYKKDRKGAVKTLKKLDKLEGKHTKAKADVDFERARVGRAKSKLKLRESKAELYRTGHNAKKVAKAKENLAKREGKLNKAKAKSQKIGSEVSSKKRSYDKVVTKVANTPVKIKRRETVAKMKRGAKVLGKSSAITGLVTGATGSPMIGAAAGFTSAGGNSTKRTKKDRFAESVDNKQKKRKASY